MKYKFFEIVNFKGIKKVKIDLVGSPQSRVFPLVGLNESGKTTILEAVNYFNSHRASMDPLAYRPTDHSSIHSLIPISQRSNFNGQISIRVGIQVEPEDRAKLAEMLRKDFAVALDYGKFTDFTVFQTYPFKNSKHDKSEKKNTWNFDLYIKRGKERKFHHAGDRTDEWQATVKLLNEIMPEIVFYPNFLFAFPDTIYLEPRNDHDAATTELHGFYRTVLQDILNSLGTSANITDHVLARAKSSEKADKESLEGLLLEMGRSVTTRVFGAWKGILKRKVDGKEVVFDINKDESGAWYLRFRIKDSDGYFTLSERSLGFRWFFVYLLLTSYRTFRKSNSRETLLLLDEPASNLHPGAQSQLLQSFEELTSKCVVIYTTHSHHLINPKWLETTYVVRNAGLDMSEAMEAQNAGKTSIQIDRYRAFVAKHPDQTSYFKPILDVLDYAPSALENVPAAVIIEGKNDFYTLQFVKKCLDLTEPSALLPGGGSGSIGSLISLYLGWGRNFAVLLDADKAGVKEKGRYIDIYGRVMEKRVISLADIDPAWNGLELEQMFSPTDRTLIQSKVFPNITTFEKKTFNLAVQECYITNTKIPLDTVSTSAFSRILTALNLVLK